MHLQINQTKSTHHAKFPKEAILRVSNGLFRAESSGKLKRKRGWGGFAQWCLIEHYSIWDQWAYQTKPSPGMKHSTPHQGGREKAKTNTEQPRVWLASCVWLTDLNYSRRERKLQWWDRSWLSPVKYLDLQEAPVYTRGAKRSNYR